MVSSQNQNVPGMTAVGGSQSDAFDDEKMIEDAIKASLEIHNVKQQEDDEEEEMIRRAIELSQLEEKANYEAAQQHQLIQDTTPQNVALFADSAPTKVAEPQKVPEPVPEKVEPVPEKVPEVQPKKELKNVEMSKEDLARKEMEDKKVEE